MKPPNNERPAMAAKRRKGKKRKSAKRKKRKVTRARKPRAAKRAAPKRRKKRKARAPKAAAPKRRKKRKLSKAHLAKMKAGREAKAAYLRKHGPPLVAKKGEGERSRYMVHKPPREPRFPIRTNPAKYWWKFCIHSGADYSEAVGHGTRSEAETKARAFAQQSRKVELLGPYYTRAMAAKAA